MYRKNDRFSGKGKRPRSDNPASSDAPGLSGKGEATLQKRVISKGETKNTPESARQSKNREKSNPLTPPHEREELHLSNTKLGEIIYMTETSRRGVF